MTMTNSEWVECMSVLVRHFPGPRHESIWQSDRFRDKFIHLPKHIMMYAIDECLNDSHNAPTVNQLSGKLPRGFSHKKDREEHAHGWQEVAGAVMCDCGKHNRSVCQCEMCVCRHENAIQDSDHHEEWWYCGDCNAALRRADNFAMKRGKSTQYRRENAKADYDDSGYANYSDDDVPF